MKIILTLEFDSNDRYAREKIDTILENAENYQEPTSIVCFTNARHALFSAIVFCLERRAVELAGCEVVEDGVEG